MVLQNTEVPLNQLQCFTAYHGWSQTRFMRLPIPISLLLFFLQHFYCTQYDNSDGMNSGSHKRENKPLAMLRLPLIPFSAARVIVILTPAVLRSGETPIDCFFTTFNIGCFTTAWSHAMMLNWPLNEDSLKFLLNLTIKDQLGETFGRTNSFARDYGEAKSKVQIRTKCFFSLHGTYLLF